MLSRELLTQRAVKLAQNAELFAKRAGTSSEDRRWAAEVIAALASIGTEIDSLASRAQPSDAILALWLDRDLIGHTHQADNGGWNRSRRPRIAGASLA